MLRPPTPRSICSSCRTTNRTSARSERGSWERNCRRWRSYRSANCEAVSRQPSAVREPLQFYSVVRDDRIPPTVQERPRVEIGPAVGERLELGPVHVCHHHETESGATPQQGERPHPLRLGRAIQQRWLHGAVVQLAVELG